MTQSAKEHKLDIIRAIERSRSEFLSLGVRRLGIFGSVARGEQKPDSDVDVLVEFDPRQKSFDNFMQLSFLLEELLRRPVDLVTVEALSPYIGPHILQEVEYVNLAA
jgi:predicted nucleotidyltransferase